MDVNPDKLNDVIEALRINTESLIAANKKIGQMRKVFGNLQAQYKFMPCDYRECHICDPKGNGCEWSLLGQALAKVEAE